MIYLINYKISFYQVRNLKTTSKVPFKMMKIIFLKFYVHYLKNIEKYNFINTFKLYIIKTSFFKVILQKVAIYMKNTYLFP